MNDESPQELLKIAEHVSSFFQRSGTMTNLIQYTDFWQNIKAASYASVLILKLTSMYSGEEKHMVLLEKVKNMSNGNLGTVPDLIRYENESPDCSLNFNLIFQT